jgi:hypothetical protein
VLDIGRARGAHHLGERQFPTVTIRGVRDPVCMTDESHDGIAQRLGWPAAIAAVTTVVGIVLSAALKQDAVWAVGAIVVLVVVIGWLGVTTRAAVTARRRIEQLERQQREDRAERDRVQCDQREELDGLQVLVGRLELGAFPQWLRVAIVHAERTDGRIDVVPDGLRFVAAGGDGQWTIELPLSTDDTAQRLTRDGLHRALGIGQREYTTALIESTR